MIRFAKKEDKKAIIDIWKNNFFDKDDYINSFLEKFMEYQLVVDENNEIITIATILPIFQKENKGRYLYALATKKEFQNRGYAKQMIGYIEDYVNQNDEKFVLLMPENEGLVEYYQKLGYSKMNSQEYSDEIGDFGKEITAKEYAELRFEIVKDGFLWNREMLEKFSAVNDMKFYKKDEIIICVENDKRVVEVLHKDKIGNDKTVLVKPKEFRGFYFNIGLD